jgi:hypothetical protein
MNLLSGEQQFRTSQYPSLHPKKFTLFCALCATGFEKAIGYRTAHFKRHGACLEENVIPFLQGVPFDLKLMFFQQNGVRPLTANVPLDI